MNTYMLAWQLACKCSYRPLSEEEKNELVGVDLRPLVVAELYLHDGTGLPGFLVQGYGRTTNETTHDLRRYLEDMPVHSIVWKGWRDNLTAEDKIRHMQDTREWYHQVQKAHEGELAE